MSTVSEMEAVVNAERRYATVNGKAHFREVMEAMRAKGWTFLTMHEPADDGSNVVIFVPQSAFQAANA